jgi:hypothetical protein
LGGNNTECKECLQGFICPGGYENLISEKGYWRENEYSLEIA